MNLENSFNYVQNMGPTFWLAALAIALGATLLLISVLTQIRNIGFQTGSFKNPFKKRHRKFQSGKSSKNEGRIQTPTIRKTATGYEAGIHPSASPTTDTLREPAQDNPDLTNRLRKAADTLEEIKQSLQRDNFKPGYSGLKDEGEGVEYLFKTTVG